MPHSGSGPDDGKFALLHNGVQVALYDHIDDAYGAGVERYGSADGELLFDIQEIGAPPAIIMSPFVR